MKKNNYTKTQNLLKFIFLFIVFLGIGYAFLEANLNINGDVTVEAPELNVYVQSTSVTEGSTPGTPTIIGNDKREVDFTTTLTNDYLHSFFEETTTLVNKGSKKAYLKKIDVKVYDSNNEEVTLPTETLQYTLTHGDDTEIELGEELAVSDTASYKLKYHYVLSSALNNVTEYPTHTFKITYTFTTDSFEDDSWSTIATKVTADPETYQVGVTKTIEMDLNDDNTNETYTLRVANNTTPSECSTAGFSQTACGFVVEFVDIIDNHRMNATVNSTDKGFYNIGSWEHSDMRALVNNGVYNALGTDYTTSGIYSHLPSDLKQVIKDTTVVTGAGYNDRSHGNFTTTDKLYLPSIKEIYGNKAHYNSDEYDTALNATKQLDYYRIKGVNNNNYFAAIKKYNGTASEWWTRTPKSNIYGAFFHVGSDGADYESTAGFDYGVSPLFKIGINE